MNIRERFFSFSGWRKSDVAKAEVPLVVSPQEQLPAVAKNSFVEFVGQQPDVFGNVGVSLTRLLDFEDRWDVSTRVHNLVQERLALDIAAAPVGKPLNPTRIATMKARYAFPVAMLFGTLTESESGRQTDKQFLLAPSAIQNLPSRLRGAAESWREKANDMARTYQEERIPLVLDYQSILRRAVASFAEYVTSGIPEHFFDFSKFLTGDTFSQERESLAPFLAVLADRLYRAKSAQGETILSTVWKVYEAYVEHEKQQPTAQRFITFLKDTPIDTQEYRWMQVVTAAMGKSDLSPEVVLQDENVATIYRLFAENNIWPVLIRDYYGLDLLNEGTFHMRRIERILEEFRRNGLVSKLSLVDMFLNEEGRVTDVLDTVHRPSPQQLAQVQEEKRITPLKVAVRRQFIDNGPYAAIVLREEELDKFLRDRANKLASHDSRMQDDVRNMIASLQKYPEGQGTIVLPDRTSILGEELPLHRLDPRKRLRLGLHLEHKKSRSLRVVYAIYKEASDDPGIIVLDGEGIKSHDKYERENLR